MKNLILLIVCLCGFTAYSLACSRSYTIDTSPCVVGDVFRMDQCGMMWGAYASGCATYPGDDPIGGFIEGGSLFVEVVDNGSTAYATLGGYVYASFRYFVRTTPGFSAGGVNYTYSAYFSFYYDCFTCPWIFN